MEETRKEVKKDKKVKSRYGITMDEFDVMKNNQGGVCAICNGKNNDRDLAVDHCHTTGKVRGLLCGNCNRGIGYFKDSKILLEKKQLNILVRQVIYNKICLTCYTKYNNFLWQLKTC